MKFLQNIVKLISNVVVLGVTAGFGISGDERVLRADVERVVDLPVHIADLASGMKQSLRRKIKKLNNSQKNVEIIEYSKQL
jgi:hypothetical protein